MKAILHENGSYEVDALTAFSIDLMHKQGATTDEIREYLDIDMEIVTKYLEFSEDVPFFIKLGFTNGKNLRWNAVIEFRERSSDVILPG